MVLLEAACATYGRWRDELATTDLVVVGVEVVSNGHWRAGPYPYPVAPNDCRGADFAG